MQVHDAVSWDKAELPPHFMVTQVSRSDGDGYWLLPDGRVVDDKQLHHEASTGFGDMRNNEGNASDSSARQGQVGQSDPEEIRSSTVLRKDQESSVLNVRSGTETAHVDEATHHEHHLGQLNAGSAPLPGLYRLGFEWGDSRLVSPGGRGIVEELLGAALDTMGDPQALARLALKRLGLPLRGLYDPRVRWDNAAVVSDFDIREWWASRGYAYLEGGALVREYGYAAFMLEQNCIREIQKIEDQRFLDAVSETVKRMEKGE